MKTNKFFLVLSLIVSIGLLMQCEKYGDRGGPLSPDDDSDRPDWSGGNTDENPHSKGNDDSGTKKGGDYGDLYEILRDMENSGIPMLVPIAGEYYVRPVDEYGDEILRWTDDENSVDNYTPDEELWGELMRPEDVIEVDFGRLNIVRSPISVLDQALGEALKVLDPPSGLAEISLDFCGRLHSYYYNEDLGDWVHKTIDSPRENMALFRTIMQDGEDYGLLAFLFTDPNNFEPLEIAASCFAAGSDKTGTVDVHEVVYVNGFMDCYGNDAIENSNELDSNGDPKLYYNFNTPPFAYDRSVYHDRYLLFRVWEGEYHDVDSDHQHIYSINQIMEGLVEWAGVGEAPSFSRNLDPAATSVEKFAQAVDDAVQVLDFVHGDSNIEFVPEYEP